MSDLTGEQIADRFRALQHDIVAHLSAMAGGQEFLPVSWEYDKGDGGGTSLRCASKEGPWEKAGVNWSRLSGASLPESATTALKIPSGVPFTATGVSLVVHPLHPHAPTAHMNVRYFECGDRWWFGGGMDVTPMVGLETRSVRDYHRRLRELCRQHFGAETDTYERFKGHCDRYFVLPHRAGECRGVGGLFYDHEVDGGKAVWLEFAEKLGRQFYAEVRVWMEASQSGGGGSAVPPWTELEREWQMWRRSRYVEFNLLEDRGTKFGLQSRGNTDAILMSMPPVCGWPTHPQFEETVDKASREYRAVVQLRVRDWCAMTDEQCDAMDAGAERK